MFCITSHVEGKYWVTTRPYSIDLKYNMKWNKMNTHNKEKQITPKHRPWDVSEKLRKPLKDVFALSFDHGHVMGSVSGRKTERGQVSQFLQTHYVALISWCLLLWLELRWSERTIIRLQPAFTKGEKATTVELSKVTFSDVQNNSLYIWVTYNKPACISKLHLWNG